MAIQSAYKICFCIRVWGVPTIQAERCSAVKCYFNTLEARSCRCQSTSRQSEDDRLYIWRLLYPALAFSQSHTTSRSLFRPRITRIWCNIMGSRQIGSWGLLQSLCDGQWNAHQIWRRELGYTLHGPLRMDDTIPSWTTPQTSQNPSR